jgi:hypothetical protein
VSLDVVSLREAAPLEGRVVAVVRRGTSLPVMGKDGEWFAVQWENRLVYVHESTVSR